MWTIDYKEMVIWMLLAFCGGMFGAAVGGLCSFVFCGVGAIASSILMMAGFSESAGTVDAWVTWGPLFGPQTAFVGGCWAAVYARYHADFHNGRDICKPLVGLNRPDILLVGGLGGVCGTFLTWCFWLLPSYQVNCHSIAPVNSVACGVALASIVGRLAFGKTGVFGNVDSNLRRWVGSNEKCWLPWQHDNMQIMLLAIAVGFPAACLTYINVHCHLLLFGVMCVLFIFMILGQPVIAGHHFAICAYFATSATGNVAWGLAFAILAGFLCEFSAFLFVAHGDSHIDPPTVAIMLCGFIQPLLHWTGLMPYASLAAPTAKENLFQFSHMFLAGNSISGLVALVAMAVVSPLLLRALRMIPSADERNDRAIIQET